MKQSIAVVALLLDLSVAGYISTESCAARAGESDSSSCAGSTVGVPSNFDPHRILIRRIGTPEGERLRIPTDGRLVAVSAALWAANERGELDMLVTRGHDAERVLLQRVHLPLSQLPHLDRNNPYSSLTTFPLTQPISVLRGEEFDVRFQARIGTEAFGGISLDNPLPDSDFVYDERWPPWGWGHSSEEGKNWDYLISLCIE